MSIGMQMMMPVLGRPPQNALLGAALSERRKDELKQSAGGVGPMREVPMIARTDREHAQPIDRYTENGRLPCNAGPECRGASQMDQCKWKS